MLERLRESWSALLASPEGPVSLQRGIIAGAAAAMLPAFGLHLVFAVVFALLLRGSLVAAAAACLALGNPLTHAVLLPLEFMLGRWVLPPGLEFLPESGPAWLLALLPAAEETLVGGIILAVLVGALAGFIARRGLRNRSPVTPLRVIHVSGPLNTGKTSVGLALADAIPGAVFVDGDEHDLSPTLPDSQRWAGAVGRLVGMIRDCDAPCLILAYPLDATGYRRIREACVRRGASLAVVTLAPPLEVALSDRGGRPLNEADRSRIRAMYAEDYASAAFSDLLLDNTAMMPHEAARAVLDGLQRNRVTSLPD
ncbi:DUF2062 domain-containing protein [Pseudoroseomonas globiformis]|uniref:DUF2062 domain-containing protein n=1 Tax=Teichococcus globiformis TaxID=2307229 RepID=A0ABV7G4R8_9PROT